MNHSNDTAGLSWKCGIVAFCLAACSSSTSESPGLGATHGGNQNTGAAPQGSNQNGGGIDAGPDINVGGSSGSATGQGASPGLGSGGVCNADSHEGQRLPLDMYFLVDSSLSMQEQIQGGGSRWTAVSGALTSFLKDPRNGESALGLGYFPFVPTSSGSSCQPGDPNCLCILTLCIPLSFDSASCKVDDYSKPTVPLALPPNAAPLVADLQGHMLNGGTPTRPALEGAVKYVTSWVGMHPERKSVIVLATDGEPSGCEPNGPQEVADVAAAALASPAAIQTFVIGVGNSLQQLNLVAAAGGTKQAYLVEDSNASTAFAQALEDIRGVASPCDFAIPTQGSNPMVDPAKVNVEYTPTGSTTPTLVAQTSDGSATTCGPDGGWHYDNPTKPSAIKLCPTTCASLGGGSVAVKFGCQTVVQQPR